MKKRLKRKCGLCAIALIGGITPILLFGQGGNQNNNWDCMDSTDCDVSGIADCKAYGKALGSNPVMKGYEGDFKLRCGWRILGRGSCGDPGLGEPCHYTHNLKQSKKSYVISVVLYGMPLSNWR